jgi:NADPH:quinone reductase-like Zn-dependent oxidoreductase
MKAIVVEQPGNPEVLQIQEIPRPVPPSGWVLIQVKAFGLNRSELYTRQGHSPSVRFPRVLGIECVGIVEAAPGTEFKPGQKVAALLGGMGRDFDGGYGEYTCVPQLCVFPLETDLDWATVGAIPEMFQTAWGSLHAALNIQAGQTLLIRGGTSSVGMAATQLAKQAGLTVLATTRSPGKVEVLQQNGVDTVVMDTGMIAQAIHDLYPQGVDRVLELVGTVTLLDSLQCAAPQGVVCMTGILGDEWVMRDFEPLEMIPSTVKLTVYAGVPENLDPAALQAFLDRVARGEIQVNLDRTFQLEEIVEAHRYMEANRGAGKLVVVLES